MACKNGGIHRFLRTSWVLITHIICPPGYIGRICFTELLDSSCLDSWPFGILTLPYLELGRGNFTMETDDYSKGHCVIGGYYQDCCLSYDARNRTERRNVIPPVLLGADAARRRLTTPTLHHCVGRYTVINIPVYYNQDTYTIIKIPIL